jgi:hypothetical protein
MRDPRRFLHRCTKKFPWFDDRRIRDGDSSSYVDCAAVLWLLNPASGGRHRSVRAWHGLAPGSWVEAVPAARGEDERRDGRAGHEECEVNVLVARPRGVEEVVYGEKVDVISGR